MSYTIHWTSIPKTVRLNIIEFINHDFQILEDEPTLVQQLQAELAKCNGYYTEKNITVFESEEDYTWFLLRWS